MANTGSLLFCELSSTEITQVMESVFPECKLVAYSLCSGGLFNTTYKVTISLREDIREFVLRVGPIRRELLMAYEHDMMQTEADIYSIMQKHKIPCSSVVAVNTERRIVDRDFMIVEYIDSRPFSGADIPQEDRYRIEMESGRMIRKMHEIECNGFGRATDVLYGQAYLNYFESIYAEIQDLCDKLLHCDVITKEEAGCVLSAVKKHEAILKETTRSCLCHGDMWSGNVLIQKNGDKWSLAALIDVDRAYFGDVDFDLGNPWILSDAFLEGYGITREELEERSRKIKREIAALVYFLIETYVWHAQYNGPQNAQNAKATVLEKCKWLMAV